MTDCRNAGGHAWKPLRLARHFKCSVCGAACVKDRAGLIELYDAQPPAPLVRR